ncbi:hypothetical protein HYPSUDRAFT_212794 [Hypholoma sublateritium FD-334 SS-4]|uniref:F-box domain-containing protein n=1 Tax=Hypholoma sublateritium (strain FD-334 SS-4) TaxID=945553 RepID=A0A0D2PF08_HYPSF|nr:hypothetical protein HYPSUDRAFT_212794 [Hypholoma sublateritium FD-334 SS-4]
MPVRQRAVSSELAAIDRQIDALQARRAAARRLAILEEEESAQIGHSPISNLPPEIYGLIFSLCAVDECDLDCASVDRRLFGPSVLCRVSPLWRAHAINNPSLWTTIHVRPLSADILGARLWLERSENLPLRVNICSADEGWLSHRVMAPLLQQFLPYCHRIQSFNTALALETLPTLFDKARHLRMPNLEELQLLVDDLLDTDFILGELFAPKLHRLHVRDMTLIHKCIGSCFANVTTLTVEYSPTWKSPHIFPHLLASCVQVRACHLVFPFTVRFNELAPIELPELRTLTLEWHFLFHAADIFSALRAPKLRALHLVHRSMQLSLPQHILGSLCALALSAPHLHKLTVEGCHVPRELEVHALLTACRALERLEIVRCTFGERFVAALTPPPIRRERDTARGWICPRLTHVAFEALADSDVRPIVCFARARTDPAAGALANGARYLKELALHTEVYALTRHARLLMLSGLLEVQRAIDIVGPFGALLDAA